MGWVESRSRCRLRMRCELESLLHTVPFHDPCSERATTVAKKTREEAWRTEAVTSLGIASRADAPARDGGGRRLVRRAVQDQAERVSGDGGERKPPRRHLIDAARAHFADHHPDRAVAQRFLHRPQHVAPAYSGDRDQPPGSNPHPPTPRAINRALSRRPR